MISIFDYTNYRNYLRDAFAERKKALPCFSHRYLSAKLGISSSNQILLVIQGKRNLTESVREKLSKFLGLSSQEDEYFEYLASFLHAKNLLESRLHFDKMIEIQSRQRVNRVDDAQFNYYSKWYNAVIRELVTDPAFKGGAKEAAAGVLPRITVRQAKGSIDLLLHLGLIEKKGNRYLQKERFITSGDKVFGKMKSFLIRNFHFTMANIAADFYRKNAADDHNFTCVTVGLSDSQYEEVVRELSDFRKKVLSKSVDTAGRSRIYQLNLQLFPVSRPTSISQRRASLANG
jgi:uncharacterized protein (TIGR02147 family)